MTDNTRESSHRSKNTERRVSLGLLSHGESTSFESYFNRWMRECRAMTNHAFANGKKVPAKLMKLLESLEAYHAQASQRENRQSPSLASAEISQVEDPYGTTPMERLTHLHNALAQLVHPASPQTILLSAEEKEKGSFFLFLGQFPIVRRMMFTACMCLFCLICSSLTPLVNATSIHQTIFDSSGVELLMVFIFLLSAAGLGASFSALFKMNRYIALGTFDPKYETSYWIRFLVGLISGLILTQVLSFDFSEALSTQQGANLAAKHAAKVTLALLGGFSADLVFNILNRMVDTVSSFLIPNKNSDPETVEKEITLKHGERLLGVRQGVSKELTTLKKMLATNADPGEIDKAMDKCMEAFDEG
ncbi:MAG: hypothetical protein JXR76_29650 [Deltaproteobacteria bacterium]|nr:hypothetical protein [Deltaproteobacteria bacterium]